MSGSERVIEVLLKCQDVTGAAVAYLQIEDADRTVALAEAPEYVSGPALREYLWGELGDAEAPDGVLVLEHIPRAAGELHLAAIADAVERHREDLFFRAPADQMECAVAAIWADVLELPRVSACDDFLDLGGDSVGAMRIITEVDRVFAVFIDVHDLLDASTVRRLATVIQARQGREAG